MINRLANTSQFFISYFVLLGLSIIFYFYQEHGDFVLLMNQLHNPVWDFVFKYWTHTGTVSFFAIVTFVVFVFRRRPGLILGFSGLLIGGITFFFKRVLFTDTPRPRIFFEEQKILEFVDGVNVLTLYSFPSGHAMAAFGLATFLSLVFQKNSISLALLVAATLTALSRVYLAQHFLIDVMAGSLIGVIISTFCFLAFERYINKEPATLINTADEELQALDLTKEDVD